MLKWHDVHLAIPAITRGNIGSGALVPIHGASCRYRRTDYVTIRHGYPAHNQRCIFAETRPRDVSTSGHCLFLAKTSAVLFRKFCFMKCAV